LILDDIIDYKKIEVKERKREKPVSVLEYEISKKPKPIGFLKKSENIQLIAELKKASPSKGVIRTDFNPVELAESCVLAGAKALSVLTDEKFFQGSLNYLSSVKETVKVPVLRKDFIIDEYQIIESRANGADAVLLLANVLNLKDMQKFLDLSRGLGLKCLVETHTEDEIKMVLDTDAEIIGINNRDLKTFKVDIGNTERLIKMIPKEKVIISESGISNKNDVKYIQDLGVDGMLVGGSIMSEKNVEDKIVELLKND
jgi:indole-3-glycerol phosphate synthase